MTARGLTLSYAIALGLVALLFVASHLVLSETLRSDAGAAAIMNLSGRQRMLSQRIVATALEVERGDESARAPLEAAIGEFTSAHRRLLRLSSGPSHNRLTETRLKDTYFGPIDTDARVRQFADAAGRVAATRGLAGPTHADAADLALLVTASRGPLLRGLEQVVSIYQQESEARARRLDSIQWWILAIGLITLVVEALFIFRPMVARIAAHVRQLLQLADNDYLTGVCNRRAFTRRACGEIERARRHDRCLALLLLDVDHFKKVNDVHGHIAGDAVLVALAQILNDVARRDDAVGRIGGEEFALLLPETTLSQAGAIAERLRLAVAAAPIDADGTPIKVTISIGVAAVAVDGTDPLKSALGTADNMLYRAKDAGRNCVWPLLTSAPSRAA